MAKRRKGWKKSKERWIKDTFGKPLDGYREQFGFRYREGDQFAYCLLTKRIDITDHQRKTMFLDMKKTGVERVKHVNGYICSLVKALGVDSQGNVLKRVSVAA